MALPRIYAFGITSILLAVAWLMFAVSTSSAATLDVCPSGCTYTTVQAAVDAAASGDTIDVGAGTYVGSVTIIRNVTIQGAGAGLTILDGGGSGNVVLTNYYQLGTFNRLSAAINDLTITNGARGVANNGIATLSRVVVRDNSGAGNGAGIANSNGYGNPWMAVIDSTVRNNSAVGGGGGIYNNGSLTVTRSTISNNTAGDGGGGLWTSKSLTVNNSTVSGNTAGHAGGGIYLQSGGANLSTTNTTIANNVVTTPTYYGSYSAGIYRALGTVKLKNTVVGGNMAGTTPRNCDGHPGYGFAATSLGYNVSNDGTCGLTGVGDLTQDPFLGPLQDNGGLTFTHALLSGSPAIDRVPFGDCPLVIDQRGQLRPSGAACDSGAFESTTPIVTSLTPYSAEEGGVGFTMTIQGNNFLNSSVVQWNGVALPTTFVSATTLEAAIAASDIASSGGGVATSLVSVLNSVAGGVESNVIPFTIVSAAVGVVESSTSEPGETSSATVAPGVSGGSGVSATATNNTAGSEPVTVTTAGYTEPPAGDPGVFDVGGEYVDLKVTGADAADTVAASFYYPSSVTGAAETSLLLIYYTGTEWASVLSSGGVLPTKNTTDNLDTTVSGGRFSVTFDDTSTPKVTELTGTVFTSTSDDSPPVVTPTIDGTLGGNGWYVSDVTVSWSVSDPDSAVSATSGCDTVNVIADTAGDLFTCTATSLGGTSSPSVTIKRDATAPLAVASQLPLANSNGWNNSDVTVSFTGTDIGSGIDSCTVDGVLSSEGAGQSASGTCTDLAGNESASASAVGINIDKTAPIAAAAQLPLANSNGWNNSDVTVSFTGTDAGSGTDFCTVDEMLTSEGTDQSASGTCTDLAGNVSALVSVAGINIDKTAPILTPPSDQTTPAVSVNGVVVAFVATASDALSGVDTLTSSPASGFEFPLGATTVTHTAVDLAGNSIEASHTVTVLGAQDLFFQTRDSLVPFVGESEDIEKAVKELNKVEPGLWIDQLHVDPKHGDKAFDRGKSAVKKLDKLGEGDEDEDEDEEKSKEVTDEALVVSATAIDDLVTTFRLLAQIAIDDAVNAPVDDVEEDDDGDRDKGKSDDKREDKEEKDVAKAMEELAEGDAERADGKPDKAIDHYRQAWKKVAEAEDH